MKIFCYGRYRPRAARAQDPSRRAVPKPWKSEYDSRDRLSLTGERVSSPSDLKTIGLKATLPRLRILELFESSPVRHLSAEDVYKMLSKDGTDTGLATVYRVLTQFEQAGLLIRHHFESGKAVFELNQGGHHDHLVCMQCGLVEEFYDAEIEKRQMKIAADRGFKIHDHSLHIYADCIRANCPNKPKS
ncbi:MAG: ferric iron uptake transcriptional regulator [Betaproteobacteria bacterium]|nr:ferric iron uptake transcriptional regulator [Betaproteobacteria bacterium]